MKKRNLNLAKRTERKEDIEINLTVESNINNINNNFKSLHDQNTFLSNLGKGNHCAYDTDKNNIFSHFNTDNSHTPSIAKMEKNFGEKKNNTLLDYFNFKNNNSSSAPNNSVELSKGKNITESKKGKKSEQDFANSSSSKNDYEQENLLKIKEFVNQKTAKNLSAYTKKNISNNINNINIKNLNNDSLSMIKTTSNNKIKNRTRTNKLIKNNSDSNNNTSLNNYFTENPTLLDLHQNKLDERESEKAYLAKDLKFLAKKSKRPIIKEVKCLKCRRPFERSTNEKWKDLCIYCYLKKTGYLVDCTECFKKMFIFPYQLGSEAYKCQECFMKLKGIKSTCSNHFCAKKTHYRKPENTHLIDTCEECYLKAKGAKLKCKDCNKDLFVYKGQKSWKTRCYDCWIKWE